MINLSLLPYGANFYNKYIDSNYFSYFDRSLSVSIAELVVNKLLDFMYSNNFTIQKTSDMILDYRCISKEEELYYSTIIADKYNKDSYLSTELTNQHIRGFGTKINNLMFRFFEIDADYFNYDPDVFWFNSVNHLCVDIFFSSELSIPENYEGCMKIVATTIDAMMVASLVKNTDSVYCLTESACINIPFGIKGLQFTIDYYTRVFYLFNSITVNGIDMLNDTLKKSMSEEWYNKTIREISQRLILVNNEPIKYEFNLQKLINSLIKNNIYEMDIDTMTKYVNDLFADIYDEILRNRKMIKDYENEEE